jgi:DNA-binding winged helix-turn-helix (wHTH) protein
MRPFEKYPPSPRFNIGPLQIDLERGTVSDQNGAAGLTSRAEHLLLLLARYPNLLVTREQILETVWAGRVVEDAAITNCVWQIRKALGERGKEILLTRAKRGYVLMVADSDWTLDATPEPVATPLAPVQALPDSPALSDEISGDVRAAGDDSVGDAVTRLSVEPTSIVAHAPKWSRRFLVALLLAVVLCGAVAWRFLRAPPDPIVLRPDIAMSMAIVAPDSLDWLRAELLRNTIENIYLHGSRVVLFEKAQTRNPFAGPHLQIEVTQTTKTEVEAELTLAQGDTVVRENFRGPAQALAETVQALLTRTFGATTRRPTRAIDALVSGWAAEQRFDHPRAIEEFRRAVARDPALNDARIALASALLEQGQGNEAQTLVDSLLTEPRLDAQQRCTIDEMLAEISPERLQPRPCERAERISRLGKLEMRDLLREVGASRAPKDPSQWLSDETAAIFAHIRLADAGQAEGRLARAQRTASEAGWEHARIELGTLRGTSAIHNGQIERGVLLQLKSADAFDALGDVRTALRERMVGLRKIPILPGPDIDARRSQVRAIVDRARAIGSVRAEIDALYLLARLDRGRMDEWRAELARILALLEEAYPPQEQTRDLHFVLNEMQVQHRYGEVLDGVSRIERSGATQPQAQLWNLTLRAESHFARDELDQAAIAVDAMARENFESKDTNSCLYAWLFAEAHRPQRAYELLAVCRSNDYDRAARASRADPALVAEARLFQLNGEPDRAWPTLRPRIDALLATPDLTLREAESLALLARHATGLIGADRTRLTRALAIVEDIARRDGAGIELQTGAHLLRWRLCAAAGSVEGCGSVLPPWAQEDRLEQRLALEAAVIDPARKRLN